MAAGLGFKTFTTGEVLTAADTNGYLMQGVLVFASSAARAAAITSPQEGQYSYLKDTNSTEYYDGAAWIAAPIGDITGVTAGTGISGGGTSGTVTVTNSMATEITAAGDIIVGTGSGTFDNLPIGTTGQLLTADTTVSPYKVKWATPAAGGTTFSGARVTKSASQSCANATYTTITWNQEPLDVGGYHDNATNNTRLTIPTGKTGYFLVQWNFHPYNVSGCSYKLLKNGSSIAEWSDSFNWTSGTEVDFTNQWLGALSAGDYVEVQFQQTTGGARNVYGGTGTSEPSWFQITYLGA